MQSLTLFGLVVGVPLFLFYRLTFMRPVLTGGWKSYLAWEGLPLLIFIFLNALISGLNWPYEDKFFMVRPSPPAVTFGDVYFGPILFAIAFAHVLLATGLLFLGRLFYLRLSAPDGKWFFWIPVVILNVGITLLVGAVASIILLGPAGITMFDQMTNVPVRDGNSGSSGLPTRI